MPSKSATVTAVRSVRPYPYDEEQTSWVDELQLAVWQIAPAWSCIEGVRLVLPKLSPNTVTLLLTIEGMLSGLVKEAAGASKERGDNAVPTTSAAVKLK